MNRRPTQQQPAGQRAALVSCTLLAAGLAVAGCGGSAETTSDCNPWVSFQGAFYEYSGRDSPSFEDSAGTVIGSGRLSDCHHDEEHIEEAFPSDWESLEIREVKGVDAASQIWAVMGEEQEPLLYQAKQ